MGKRKKPVSVIAPDGREVVTKYDSQGREKRITTKRDKSQPRSEFNKRDSQYIPKIERQRRQNAENPVFAEEDKIPVYPKKEDGGTVLGFDPNNLKSSNFRKH